MPSLETQARLDFEDIENAAVNLQVISAKTAEELMSMLQQLRGPVKVKTIYGLGARHYAWFSTEQRVVVKKKTKKKRGKKNGRFKGQEGHFGALGGSETP